MDSRSRSRSRGGAIQFYQSADLVDVASPFLLRKTSDSGILLLQSHGWVDGMLLYGTLEDAALKYNPADSTTWPLVVPRDDAVFVDHSGTILPSRPRPVQMERLRHPSLRQPKLSVVIFRWGGKKRIDEEMSDEDLFRSGGWGLYGSPPCDWYIRGMANCCTGCHTIGSGLSHTFVGLESEVLSVFLGSDNHMINLVTEAPSLAAELRGVKQTGFWMLWPADWDTDWFEHYGGYVEQRCLLKAMRAVECAGLPTSFPHPADLYEFITSKTWMATHCTEPDARLPCAVLVSREEILKNSQAAATQAIHAMNALRKNSVFAPQGPSLVNKGGIQKGVVKIGYSWEAKYVWPWTTITELAHRLKDVVMMPGCLSEYCIVQEWVDMDFELRLFFFPPRTWTPSLHINATHSACTSWLNDHQCFGQRTFNVLSKMDCLKMWMGDEDALTQAHEQAERTAQFLMAKLLAVHPEPPPFIRLDFMLKRLGPGTAQVVFGEYCETGACCIDEWRTEGPPAVWSAVVDYALNYEQESS